MLMANNMLEAAGARHNHSPAPLEPQYAPAVGHTQTYAQWDTGHLRIGIRARPARCLASILAPGFNRSYSQPRGSF